MPALDQKYNYSCIKDTEVKPKVGDLLTMGVNTEGCLYKPYIEVKVCEDYQDGSYKVMMMGSYSTLILSAVDLYWNTGITKKAEEIEGLLCSLSDILLKDAKNDQHKLAIIKKVKILTNKVMKDPRQSKEAKKAFVKLYGTMIKEAIALEVVIKAGVLTGDIVEAFDVGLKTFDLTPDPALPSAGEKMTTLVDPAKISADKPVLNEKLLKGLSQALFANQVILKLLCFHYDDEHGITQEAWGQVSLEMDYGHYKEVNVDLHQALPMTDDNKIGEVQAHIPNVTNDPEDIKIVATSSDCDMPEKEFYIQKEEEDNPHKVLINKALIEGFQSVIETSPMILSHQAGDYFFFTYEDDLIKKTAWIYFEESEKVEDKKKYLCCVCNSAPSKLPDNKLLNDIVGKLKVEISLSACGVTQNFYKVTPLCDSVILNDALLKGVKSIFENSSLETLNNNPSKISYEDEGGKAGLKNAWVRVTGVNALPDHVSLIVEVWDGHPLYTDSTGKEFEPVCVLNVNLDEDSKEVSVYPNAAWAKKFSDQNVQAPDHEIDKTICEYVANTLMNISHGQLINAVPGDVRNFCYLNGAQFYSAWYAVLESNMTVGKKNHRQDIKIHVYNVNPKEFKPVSPATPHTYEQPSPIGWIEFVFEAKKLEDYKYGQGSHPDHAITPTNAADVHVLDMSPNQVDNYVDQLSKATMKNMVEVMKVPPEMIGNPHQDSDNDSGNPSAGVIKSVDSFESAVPALVPPEKTIKCIRLVKEQEMNALGLVPGFHEKGHVIELENGDIIVPMSPSADSIMPLFRLVNGCPPEKVESLSAVTIEPGDDL